jgi:hypothetical protein
VERDIAAEEVADFLAANRPTPRPSAVRVSDWFCWVKASKARST